MTIEEKLTLLAPHEATLQTYFGAPPATFRCFERQLPQKVIQQGPCLTFRRVSSVHMYSQTVGLIPMTQPRMQFDVWVSPRYTNQSTVVARAARDAVINWLNTQVSFADPNNFASPATTPPHFPNFLLNTRAGMEVESDPPAYVETFDVRIYNLEN